MGSKGGTLRHTHNTDEAEHGGERGRGHQRLSIIVLEKPGQEATDQNDRRSVHPREVVT